MSLEVIRKIWVKMSGFNRRPSVFPRTLYLRSYIEKFLQVFSALAYVQIEFKNLRLPLNLRPINQSKVA